MVSMLTSNTFFLLLSFTSTSDKRTFTIFLNCALATCATLITILRLVNISIIVNTNRVILNIITLSRCYLFWTAFHSIKFKTLYWCRRKPLKKSFLSSTNYFPVNYLYVLSQEYSPCISTDYISAIKCWPFLFPIATSKSSSKRLKAKYTRWAYFERVTCSTLGSNYFSHSFKFVMPSQITLLSIYCQWFSHIFLSSKQMRFTRCTSVLWVLSSSVILLRKCSHQYPYKVYLLESILQVRIEK